MPLEIKSFKGTALLMSVNCCDSQGGLPPLSPLSSISHTSSSPFPCSFPLSLFPWLFTLSQHPLYPWLSLPSRLLSRFPGFSPFFPIAPTRDSVSSPSRNQLPPQRKAGRRARNYTSICQHAILFPLSGTLRHHKTSSELTKS